MTRIPDVSPIKAHLNIFVKTICQRLKKLKLDWGIAEEVEKFSETRFRKPKRLGESKEKKQTWRDLAPQISMLMAVWSSPNLT